MMKLKKTFSLFICVITVFSTIGCNSAFVMKNNNEDTNHDQDANDIDVSAEDDENDVSRRFNNGRNIN